jgi:hypothetical protein
MLKTHCDRRGAAPRAPMTAKIGSLDAPENCSHFAAPHARVRAQRAARPRMARPCRCVGGALQKPGGPAEGAEQRRWVLGAEVGPRDRPGAPRTTEGGWGRAGRLASGAALLAGCPRSLAPGCRRCRAAAADSGGSAARPRLRRGCAAGTAAPPSAALRLTRERNSRGPEVAALCAKRRKCGSWNTLKPFTTE